MSSYLELAAVRKSCTSPTNVQLLLPHCSRVEFGTVTGL